MIQTCCAQPRGIHSLDTTQKPHALKELHATHLCDLVCYLDDFIPNSYAQVACHCASLRRMLAHFCVGASLLQQVLPVVARRHLRGWRRHRQGLGGRGSVCGQANCTDIHRKNLHL
jgi:hypothetical protein